MGFWLNRVRPDSREVDVEKMLEEPWERQNWREACLCREAPKDMIAAIGSGYQRMFIVPSMSLVIVRQGRDDSRFSDATFLRLIFGRSSDVAGVQELPDRSSGVAGVQELKKQRSSRAME
jgi:hypothetical protein